MAQTSVLIVDDHPLVRQGLREALQALFAILGEAREGAERVQKAVDLKPDVALLDLRLPGMDGIQATRKIREQVPHTGGVIFSASDEDQDMLKAIQAGATGYVLKHEDLENIARAVELAAAGSAYLPPLTAQRAIASIGGALKSPGELKVNNGATPLSGRELEVLRLVAMGKRTREIADELSVSERTVGNHITSLYHKLHTYDRVQAIVYAIRKDIVRI